MGCWSYCFWALEHGRLPPLPSLTPGDTHLRLPGTQMLSTTAWTGETSGVDSAARGCDALLTAARGVAACRIPSAAWVSYSTCMSSRSSSFSSQWGARSATRARAARLRPRLVWRVGAGRRHFPHPCPCAIKWIVCGRIERHNYGSVAIAPRPRRTSILFARLVNYRSRPSKFRPEITILLAIEHQVER